LQKTSIIIHKPGPYRYQRIHWPCIISHNS